MTARSSITRVLLVALGAVALSAAPARAQEAALSTTPAATAANVVATPSVAPATALPTTDAAAVAVRRPTSNNREMSAPARGHIFDEGTKLMIVGGAAILTGIIVGGDAGHAISIVGAVVGLYGLYEYLQ